MQTDQGRQPAIQAITGCRARPLINNRYQFIIPPGPAGVLTDRTQKGLQGCDLKKADSTELFSLARLVLLLRGRSITAGK